MDVLFLTLSSPKLCIRASCHMLHNSFIASSLFSSSSRNQPSLHTHTHTHTASDYRGPIPWTYSGQGIDLEDTAEKLMNTTYRACLICKGTLAKPRGLKPRVVLWIYTMVIRPTLTCLHGWVAKGHTLSAGWSSKVTEISPSGHNRGDEDNPKSCNRGPPATSSSSCDDRGGICMDVHINMQPAVETQTH